MHAHGAPASSPVLDIGGEVGALIVYLSDLPPSGELELCPTGEPARRFHTGVHTRRVGQHQTEAAVFPEVLAGTYDVLDEHLQPVARVVVVGGEVAEVDLSAAAPGPPPGNGHAHTHAYMQAHAGGHGHSHVH
jgi:hypothetical protein